MPNIISSIEIWIGDSFGHFLGWKMPKMLKFRKIQFQISGQWFELGGSYFEVKISLPKASIGGLIFEKCFNWLTQVKAFLCIKILHMSGLAMNMGPTSN